MKLSLSDRKRHELQVREYVNPLMPMSNFHTLIFLRHFAHEKKDLKRIHQLVEQHSWFKLWRVPNNWKENRAGWPMCEFLEMYLLLDNSGGYWILGLELIGETDKFHVEFFRQVPPFNYKWRFFGCDAVFSPNLPPNPLIGKDDLK
jgi:hypothetical protein